MNLENDPAYVRLLTEKSELDVRISKLSEMPDKIYNALDDNNRSLLMRQSRIMNEYSSVLGERIRIFKPIK